MTYKCFLASVRADLVYCDQAVFHVLSRTLVEERRICPKIRVECGQLAMRIRNLQEHLDEELRHGEKSYESPPRKRSYMILTGALNLSFWNSLPVHVY